MYAQTATRTTKSSQLQFIHGKTTKATTTKLNTNRYVIIKTAASMAH